MNKGKLFVISGPSGVGKGRIIEDLMKNSDLNLYWAKSYTTRAERESDKDENHYLFTKKENFKKLEKEGEIIESNFFNNNWYGSSKSEIEKAVSTGKNVLKEIEVNGAMRYKEFFPEAILIFIKAPLSDIHARLISRGQNTDAEIEDRLEIAKRELEFERQYHFAVVNPQGHPEKAIEEVEKIILKEKNNYEKN